jgi:hypothetical protein
VHGLFSGMKVAVMDDGNQVGTLLATDVKDASAVLKGIPKYTSFTFSHAMEIALPVQGVCSTGITNIFIEPSVHLPPLVLPSSSNWNITGDVSAADVVVSLEDTGSKLKIQRQDPIFQQFDCPDLCVKFQPVGLDTIFQSIAHFRYHIRRSGDGTWLDNVSQETENSKISLEMFALNPRRSRLMPQGENILEGNSVHLKTGSEDADLPYGFKITNLFGRPMYFSLLSFESATYQIQIYHEHSQPVPKGGSVTVGYGPGGGHPIMFRLPENSQSDTTFFKVFASSEWVDLSILEQDSIFHNQSVGSRGLVHSRPKATPPPSWATCLAAVTITN